MIIVIGPDDSLTRHVAAVLDHGERVEVARRCADIDDGGARARVCVYVASGLHNTIVDTLVEHQRDNLYLPTLVVVGDSAQSLLGFGGARIHGVITQADLADLLPLAVNQAASVASVAEQLACFVEDNVTLPVPVARALVHYTIRSDRIRSRSKIADEAGCDLRQLDESLSKAFGRQPKTWVTWRFVVRTLRAYDIGHRGTRTNELVARELDTTTKALCRGYERVAGVRSLEELRKMTRRDVLTRALIALGFPASNGGQTLGGRAAGAGAPRNGSGEARDHQVEPIIRRSQEDRLSSERECR